MRRQRYHRLQHLFSAHRALYWSNLSRLNNLLVNEESGAPMAFGTVGQLKCLLKTMGRYLLRRLERPIPSYEQRIINNLANLYRKIRPGDVLLVGGRSRLSRIIQLMTRSAWRHADLYIGDRLKDTDSLAMVGGSFETDAADKRHMLIEAEAGSGVTGVPLSKYRDYNIRICRPFGIATGDRDTVVNTVIDNLGKHYDHENLVDLALLVLPPFLNPFRKRTIRTCLGGFTEFKVICSGMIANAFQQVGYPIVPALLPAADAGDRPIDNPYGSRLIMRHYSQIVPRDVDLSPNFEIIKYNIIGLGDFDYRSIWGEQRF